jgi:hypothetical protein
MLKFPPRIQGGWLLAPSHNSTERCLFPLVSIHQFFSGKYTWDVIVWMTRESGIFHGETGFLYCVDSLAQGEVRAGPWADHADRGTG